MSRLLSAGTFTVSPSPSLPQVHLANSDYLLLFLHKGTALSFLMFIYSDYESISNITRKSDHLKIPPVVPFLQ
mgnify:CR=1 FL=1